MKKNQIVFFQRMVLLIVLICLNRNVDYNGLKFLPKGDNEAYVDCCYDTSPHISIPSVAIGMESYYNEQTQRYEYKEKSYRVTAIGDEAFESCTSLTSVSIPSSVTSIGMHAFAYCSNLSSISIPNSVKSIGAVAFCGCTSLKSISISNSVKAIEFNTFWNCKSLTSISIPNSVKSIGICAFQNCSRLSSISIPNSVTKIEHSAFEGCTSLSSISIPNSVKTIGGNAFGNCTSLVSISIPNSVTSIGSDAFYGCTSLMSISIPNSVTSIKDWTFSGCTSLSSVYIPNSVTTIDYAAFSNCPNIKKVYCGAIIPPDVKKDRPFYYSKTLRLYVPKESVERYKSHDIWGDYIISPLMSLTIEEGYEFSEFEDIDINAKGVTADGLSKLQVIQEEDKPSDVPDLQSISVKFELDGKDCTDEKIIGTYGGVEWKGRNEDNNKIKWGFTYTAPEDFPEKIKGNEYTLDVTLESEENGLVAVVGAAQIKVMRPGLLLVHGLNSNASCFANVEKYLTSDGGYKNYQIRNVNYASSNKARFDNNTHMDGHEVIKNNAKILFRQLIDNGIVSSSYDMIGHSMGGILIRKYAQEVDKKSVNKIITVNTPHSGSPWADAYIEMVSRVDEIVSDMGAFSGFAILAHFYALYKKAYGNWGAIQDLSSSSSAIAKLNDPDALSRVQEIPVQALYSTLNMDKAVPQKVISINSKYSWLYDAFTVGTFLEKDEDGNINDVDILNRLFGKEKHDGVVPLISQRGGLTGIDLSPKGDEYKGVFGLSSDSHHCNITDHSGTFSKIYELLYTPKNSGSFVKGFKPLDLSKKSARSRAVDEMVDFKEPSESQFIKIHAEQEDTARVLKVTVMGSDDLLRNLVFIGLDEENLLTGIGQDEYQFRIPDTYEGDLTVYALGRTEDDALVSDSVVVKYEKAASLNYLFFEDWPKLTMIEGQQLELNVIGGWSNGDENYVTPDYSTNREGILDFDGSLITAKAEGECLLIANFEGLADTITVKVLSAKASSILTIEKSKASIRYGNGSLVVAPENNYTGPIAVMIYDMSGNLCYQRHRIVTVVGNEPITFDLSSLPTQLYIARVRTSDEHAIKFVKR